MTTPPKRAWEIEIKIGGDTFEDAKLLLESAVDSIHRKSNLVSGGVSSGGYMVVHHNPDMNHENYVEQLNRYLRENDKQTESDPRQLA